MPFPETGSARADLTSQISSVIDLFNDPAISRPFVALISEAPHDTELAEALRGRFIAARRADAREVFTQAVQRGEVRPDLFNDPAIDALYGALYYRLLVSGEPLTRRYAQTLVEQLYPALAMRPSP
ncbi:MAG: TetR/AcrR family transcriptional regulator C-terminal ligand-binding domain-containing protein [Nocardioidaceae bacterium]|nr:TetR/AcrR family transcriptional regulator C-terminal ligand-binding domain-containing protein [Nocardioidaceae bacterium]